MLINDKTLRSALNLSTTVMKKLTSVDKIVLQTAEISMLKDVKT